jgi:hypothetical protein
LTSWLTHPMATKTLSVPIAYITFNNGDFIYDLLAYRQYLFRERKTFVQPNALLLNALITASLSAK